MLMLAEHAVQDKFVASTVGVLILCRMHTQRLHRFVSINFVLNLKRFHVHLKSDFVSLFFSHFKPLLVMLPFMTPKEAESFIFFLIYRKSDPKMKINAFSKPL